MKKIIFLSFLMMHNNMFTVLDSSKPELLLCKQVAPNNLDTNKNKLLAVKKYFYSLVSYYGRGFIGKRTANGEVFTGKDFTCASPNLQFNTLLKVTNTSNNKSVVVRVNDRGPYNPSQVKRGKLIAHNTRALDLSEAAFQEIGNKKSGVLKVKIEILKQ